MTNPATTTVTITIAQQSVTVEVPTPRLLADGNALITSHDAEGVADAWVNEEGDFLRGWRFGNATGLRDLILADFDSTSGLSIRLWTPASAFDGTPAGQTDEPVRNQLYSTAMFPGGALTVAPAPGSATAPAEAEVEPSTASSGIWEDIPRTESLRIDEPEKLDSMGLRNIVESVELIVTDDGSRAVEAAIPVDLSTLGSDDYLNSHTSEIDSWISRTYGPRGANSGIDVELTDTSGQWSYQLVTFRLTGEQPEALDEIADDIFDIGTLMELHCELGGEYVPNRPAGLHAALAAHLAHLDAQRQGARSE